MRNLLPLLLALALAASPAAAWASDNAYDLLGRVLMPFLGLFAESKKGEHAVSVSLRVEEAEGLPPELAGASVDFAFETPDRVRLSGPLFGKRITLCRHGETVWAYPGSALKALLASPEIAAKLPAPDREYKMKPFRLPIPTKQLVFLPALFQVKSLPAAELDGRPREGLEMRLMPELARALKVEDWQVQTWVDEAGHPLRLLLRRGETQAALRCERWRFAKTLPPETWAPSASEAGDVLVVPPARYDQLWRAMIGERPEKR